MPRFGNVFGRASLSRKLTGLGVATSTIALLVAGAVLLAADVSTSRQRLVNDTAMRAEALSQNGSAPLAFRDAQSAAEVLATVSLQDHAMSAAIFNPDGSVFARYDRPSMHAPGLEASIALAAGEQGPWSRFIPGGLVVGRPIRVNGETIGTVMLTSDLDDVRLRMFDFGRIIGAAVFGAFLLAIGLAYALQRVISRPLLALTAVARDIARDGRYDRRASGDGDGEIGELINGFNGMLSEIQQRDAQLQKQHLELERTVEERTRELRTANTDLVTSRDKAMEASRAKSEFLANMSHEIRTPMNGIIGMTELALMTGPDHQLRDYLTTVKTSADSLLAILNDILDFSKIESRKLELEAIPFSVRELVVETLKPLAMKAEQTGIELLCDLDPAMSDGVIGDRLRLRQVLSNLIGNAIKFTPSGHVLVEVREQVRTGNRTTLHFQVTDTGIGIPADKHDTIFEAFSQADGSTTRRFGGTGLGLTISATLVRLMGGEIWMESVPGAGSTFHFTTSFECDATPQPSLVPEPLLADLRILIVDDNPLNRRILMAQLSRWHTRPTAVSDGPSAMAALSQAAAENLPFVLVLLDANMPGMDGFDVAEQIASRPELAGATIMMLTSSGRYGDVSRCRALGIAAYLTKPVGADDLHAAIGRVLQGGPKTIAALDAAETPPAAARPRALRLLLAEDNVVNQRVAVGMLSARGHSVTVANNGAEALAALAGGTFDVVLMDVQMPVMGGLEATEEIRRRERESGTRVRIVAMTAHAMRGDRDRCLAAGMDGYLSKPIDPVTLFAVVEQEAAAPIQPELAAPDAPRTAVDMDAVMRRLNGDQNLFQEVAQLFLEDCPLRLENIDAAVASADLEQIRSAAHALKGAAGNLSAAGLVAAARSLEACGSDGRLDETGAAAGQVAIEARRVMAFLQSQLAPGTGVSRVGRMRILIADDDPVSRRLLEVALVRMGHSVVVVSEGLAAIEALVATDGPKIAILDWMMPGADGLAVCRAVRQRAAPYVYVILLTARDSQADMVAALDAEADEFLTKPFDAIELRGRLHAGERILKLQEGLLQAHDALQHQASHDHLTGLWNRRMVLQQLNREVQRSARDRSELAVILADIDRFKLINDTYGHAAGDTVLQQVAGLLRSTVRDHEYLARYGGEEFLILLPGCTAQRAVSVAERARASIAANPVLAGGQPIAVRISLGVATTAESGVDPAVLIAAADAALYQAKAGGRDQVGRSGLAATA